MENDMNKERIYPDKNFWEVQVVKAKALFDRAILPEWIGKFYSGRPNTPLQEKLSCSSLDCPEYPKEVDPECSEESLAISESPTETLDISETQGCQ